MEVLGGSFEVIMRVVFSATLPISWPFRVPNCAEHTDGHFS